MSTSIYFEEILIICFWLNSLSMSEIVFEIIKKKQPVFKIILFNVHSYKTNQNILIFN